jgi:hypothetical protein
VLTVRGTHGRGWAHACKPGNQQQANHELAMDSHECGSASEALESERAAQVT